MKGTVEEVTIIMALLDCKHAGTWEQKHIQLECTVSLSEHPQQQELFNSFVEINVVKKPHTDHKGVRTIFFFLVHFGFLCQVLESVRCLFAHFFVFRRAICFSLMHGDSPLKMKGKDSSYGEKLKSLVHTWSCTLAGNHAGECPCLNASPIHTLT